MNKNSIRNELPLKEGVCDTNKTCILFISENELECEIAFDMLESFGYTTIVSSNEKHALDIFCRFRKMLDVVIIDMAMSKRNGLEIFEAMRRISPKVRAILSSDNTIPNTVLKQVNQAVLGFVQKPYNKTELSQKLDEIIREDPISSL